MSLFSAGSPLIIEGVDGPVKDNIVAHLELNEGKVPLSILGFPRSNEYILRNVRAALKALGYYSPNLTLSGGHEQWNLTVDVGLPIRWASINLKLMGEGIGASLLEDELNEYSFHRGDKLNHGDYAALKTRLQSRILELGYFEANFETSELVVDPDKHEAHLNWSIVLGPRYQFGEIAIKGSELSSSFLKRFYNLSTTDFYDQADVIKAQQALNRSGYFSYVSIKRVPDTERKKVDVKIELQDREKYELKTSVGYGTDSGGRLGLSWRDRRVNDSGHNYIASLELSEISSGIDFQYRIPLMELGDEWINRFSYRLKNEDIARSKITSIESRWVDKLNDYWSFQWAATIAAEEISSNDVIESYLEYLVPSWQVDYYSLKDPFRVKNGWHWHSVIRLSDERISDPDLQFIQWEQKIKWIYSFNEDWRFLWRFQSGITDMELDKFINQMPTTYRFFAGGDTSVRGYEYQSLAPRDGDGNIIGGRYLLTQSAEIDWEFKDNWRWALFTDAGDAFNHKSDYELSRSVGMGIRWVTPVGAIRFDVARGLDDPKEWRWHITIGPDL